MANMRAMSGASATSKHKSLRGALFAALMVFAYLAQALVPQGWMPVRDAEGGLSFVICTAQGLAQGAQDDGTPLQKKANDHQVCPFAGANAPVTASATAILHAPLAGPAQKLLALEAIPQGAWRLALYSSRAPPVLL